MNEGLVIFIVGMITVFTVLLLVVLTGRILVNLVNRFYVEPQIDYAATEQPYSNEVIAPQEIAAITAAVQIITKGKGKITSIVKKNE
jgi:oxaloacetate decarboxylase gamma subunit